MKAFPLKVITFSLIFAGSSAWSQTLEQAVSATLQSNPELRQVFNGFKSKVSNATATQGRYLPSIDLDAGIGYEGIDPATSTGNQSTDLTRKEATLSLTQLIWDGSSTLNSIDRSQALAEAQRYHLLSDASDKALDVAKIYLDSVKAEEILQLAEDNLAHHKSLLAETKNRAKSQADLSQIDARIAKAQAALVKAKNDWLDAQTQFKALVGDIPEDLIYPQADQAFMPDSLDSALAVSVQQHPLIKVGQVDVDAARFKYEESQSVNFPTLSLEASQSWKEDADGFEGSSSETSAMIHLRYNLFNGGSDKANIQSNAYQLNQAKDMRESSYRHVEETTTLAWNSLALSSQQKAFLSDNVDSVAKTVVGYTKQYRTGHRPLLDLINAQDELFAARKSYLDTKYTEQYAKYRVLNSTGTLLDALRVEIPEEWTAKVEY